MRICICIYGEKEEATFCGDFVDYIVSICDGAVEYEAECIRVGQDV